MIWEILVWLALQALVYEVQVLTAILAVCFGYEVVGRWWSGERVPFRMAMWRALRFASVVGALIAVASRVIVGSALSFVSGQLGDLLLLVIVSVTAGAVWRLSRIKRQRRVNRTGSVPDRSTAEPLDVSQ